MGVLTDDDFKHLYELEERKLFNIALRYLGQREDALDSVHDGFCGLWKNKHKLTNPDEAKAYVFRCVINSCLKKLRWQKLKHFVSFETSNNKDRGNKISIKNEIHPEREFIGKEEVQLVQKELKNIPEKYRSVLLLNTIGGMNYQEIARTLNIPEGTVASRKNHALRTIQSRLRGRHE